MKLPDGVEVMLSLLAAEGFVTDGETRKEVVRVPTQRSPLLGRGGGELRSFGGRQRLSKPGTDLRATVGPRTTFVYRALGGGKVESILHASTVGLELAVIREAIRASGDERGVGRSTDRFSEGTDEDRREWALEDKHDLEKEGG
jgi:hypothetical protein